MVLFTWRTIYLFTKQHPSTVPYFNRWKIAINNANWENLVDIKKEYPSVDYVGNDRYVFNVNGNDFRLVVMIHFSIRTIYVRFIGNHESYNKIDCSKI